MSAFARQGQRPSNPTSKEAEEGPDEDDAAEDGNVGEGRCVLMVRIVESRARLSCQSPRVHASYAASVALMISKTSLSA